MTGKGQPGPDLLFNHEQVRRKRLLQKKRRKKKNLERMGNNDKTKEEVGAVVMGQEEESTGNVKFEGDVTSPTSGDDRNRSCICTHGTGVHESHQQQQQQQKQQKQQQQQLGVEQQQKQHPKKTSRTAKKRNSFLTHPWPPFLHAFTREFGAECCTVAFHDGVARNGERDLSDTSDWQVEQHPDNPSKCILTKLYQAKSGRSNDGDVHQRLTIECYRCLLDIPLNTMGTSVVRPPPKDTNSGLPIGGSNDSGAGTGASDESRVGAVEDQRSSHSKSISGGGHRNNGADPSTDYKNKNANHPDPEDAEDGRSVVDIAYDYLTDEEQALDPVERSLLAYRRKKEAEAKEEAGRPRITMGTHVSLGALTSMASGKWVILLVHGGLFAGAVFDKVDVPHGGKPGDTGGKCVDHKTYHRYVVRKKSGKRQSNRDAHGSTGGTVGSQLRRGQEKKWMAEWRLLLSTTWKAHLREATAIFVYAPGRNYTDMFWDDGPLRRNDERVLKVPMPTFKPGFKEATRVYQELSSVRITTEPSLHRGLG